MARMTRRRWWPVVVLGCVLLAGCSGTPPSGSPPSAAPGEGPSAAAAAPDGMSAKTGAPDALSASAGESPADKALQLEALLGQHSVLAADLMRGRIRNDDDFGQVANAAVTRNTDDLATMVGSLFGDQAANAFRGLWTDHVTALFNYSRGLATDDAAVRDDAKAQLVAFENGLADFFSSAAEGRLPRDTARAAVQAHVEHLTEQADAYAAKDYARSDELYRETYAHTFDLGHVLAATLLPPDQAAALNQPSWQLRSALDRLLGEHVALAVGALRAGGTNSPDFPAAAAALNGNTSDLSGAVGTLFGAQAGQQFMALWADHVDQLVGLHDGGRGGRRRQTGGRPGQAAGLRGQPRRLPRLRHGQQDALGGSREGIPGPRPDAHAAGRRLRRARLLAGVRPRLLHLPGHVRPLGSAGGRLRGDGRGPASARRRAHGGRGHGGPNGGSAGRPMRGTAAARGALAVALAVMPVTALAGSQAAERTQAQLTVASTTEPPTAGTFRSVRSYARVPEPVRLRIPAAGVDAGLVRLGRAADGSIEVPAQFDVAGWYDEGPRPGQPGPAVVLGHVDSRTGPAVFYRVAALPRDAQVLVDRADGSTVGFRVSGTQRVPKVDFPTDRVYGPTLEPSLRLVTCGGSFDRVRGTYQDNVIVYADPAA